MDRRWAHIDGWFGAVARVPGAELARAGGVTSVVSDIGWPMFNGVVSTPDSDPAAVRDVMTTLRDNGRPWFFWELPGTPPTHTGRAAEHDAVPFDDRAPWMEARTSELATPEIPDGIEVEEAVDAESWRRWVAAMREIYEFPAIAEEAWLEPARRLDWHGVPWRCWTALRDGRAVGCTLLIEAGGVAGLLGVGVLPEERRRGVGRLMTLLPLAHATEEWAGFYTTAQGGELYRTLGFAENGWITRWLGN